LVLLALSACASDPGKLPDVPEFKQAATTTTAMDYAQVGLKGVSGKSTTTSVVFGPGRANLNGTVVSDQGVVAGASVIVERIVDGTSASQILFTAEDGTWSLPAVLGGRYRVRAWRQPDLAQTTPSAVFLGATETKSVELKLREVGGLGVAASLAPNPPLIDTDINLVVLVTQKTVDANGVVRGEALPGSRVDLVGSGAWRVVSSNPVFTDGSGQAKWVIRCRAAGRQPLAVNVGTQSFPLNVENCVDPSETTTTVDVTVETEPN
jgi:hypothetical protein